MNAQEVDVRNILNLLQRRMRLIFITFAVCIGIAGITAFALPSTFTASTLVLIDLTRKNLLDPELQTTAGTTDNARIESEVEILRSDALLLEVIANNDLVSDPEFGMRRVLGDQFLAFFGLAETGLSDGQEAQQKALASLKAITNIQRRGLTYVIAIEAQSRSPEKAANLANAIAEAYIDDQLRSKIDAIAAASDIVNARLIQARNTIITNEELFGDLLTSSIDHLVRSQPNSSIATLQRNLDATAGQRSHAQALADTVAQASLAHDWDTLLIHIPSEAALELDRRRGELTANLSQTDQNSPAANTLRNELAAVEAQLTEQISRQLETLQLEVAYLDEQVGTLHGQIRSDIFSTDMSLDMLAQFYELQQSSGLARSQYQQLLARSADLRVQAELQIADSRIISPAIPPSDASFPNTRLILLFAGLTGLGLGVGLAFVQENFVGGFTTESQLSAVLHIPAVGTIPLHRPPAHVTSVSDTLTTAPLSQYSESMRRVRAEIDQHLRRKLTTHQQPASATGKVIMACSSVPGEGKTTVALSLARTYAQAGKKTLLIDCDLRYPAIHLYLGIDSDVGLIDYLLGEKDNKALASLILHDKETGLSILVGSHQSEIPTDQLISSAAFEHMMKAAVENFEIVILDTPPILSVVDGLYLATHADVLLFIVKWSSTAQGEARMALTRMDRARKDDALILGAMNQYGQQQVLYGS